MRYAISDELAAKLANLLKSSKDDEVYKFYQRLQNRLDLLKFEEWKIHDKQTRDEAGEALAAHVNEQIRLGKLPTEATPNHPNSEDD